MDASTTGIGGELAQLENGIWKPLAFYSKSLSPAQQKYSAFERELIAARNAITHFRHVLRGREFILVSDSQALVQKLNNGVEALLARLQRALDIILNFAPKVIHKPGSEMLLLTLYHLYMMRTVCMSSHRQITKL